MSSRRMTLSEVDDDVCVKGLQKRAEPLGEEWFGRCQRAFRAGNETQRASLFDIEQDIVCA